jgi:hypothetical protein
LGGLKHYIGELKGLPDMGGPSLLSLGHVQGEAAILTLPVTLSGVGSNRGKLCCIVVAGAGADSVTI